MNHTTELSRQSALHIPADLRSTPGRARRQRVWLEERADFTHLNLRGSVDEVGFNASVAAVVGVALPRQPNRVAHSGPNLIYWLGPDEWLIVSSSPVQMITVPLVTALEQQHYALVDVSGGQMILRIGGAEVRNVIASGCTLDLHPRAFEADQCAQSLLAGIPVLVHRVGDLKGGSIFDLLVRRSFAQHLFDWLIDAAREVGIVVQAGRLE